MSWNKESWQGAITFVLALTVGICITSVVVGMSSGVVDLGKDTAVWIGGALGVCLGIVGTYITGYVLRHRRDRGDKDES